MHKTWETADIKVIIPAFNEEHAIGKVISEIPGEIVSEVIVVNNGSTDGTGKAAREMGATVLQEPRKGYGAACLKGMEYIAHSKNKPGIIVFLDADYSDYPRELPGLIAPILQDTHDLVIGSRALGKKETGSMTLPQVFGNWLATRLLKLFYGANFTDLGPFRAIRYQSLISLGMRDLSFGWTVEMQLKAVKMNLRCTEVPVRYRVRIGKSKVSGTIRGAIMAGYKILWTIFKYL